MAATVPERMKQYGYFGEDTYQPEVADLCLRAAKEYLKGADVPEKADSALYDMACYMLAMHWYDHRGVVTIGTVQGEIALGVNSIIHQIQNSGGASV